MPIAILQDEDRHPNRSARIGFRQPCRKDTVEKRRRSEEEVAAHNAEIHERFERRARELRGEVGPRVTDPTPVARKPSKPSWTLNRASDRGDMWDRELDR